jgi:hypothetical protein
MSTTQHSLDATLAGLGSKATQAGAGTSIVGWALSSEAAVLVGITVGVVGLAVQWWYQRKRDKREQAEHERRMKDRDR